MALIPVVISLPGSPASITLSPDNVHRRVIDMIAWSYSGVPQNGTLSITDNGVTVFTMDVILAGHGQINFKTGLAALAGDSTLIITLAGAGLTIIGKLNIE